MEMGSQNVGSVCSWANQKRYVETVSPSGRHVCCPGGACERASYCQIRPRRPPL